MPTMEWAMVRPTGRRFRCKECLCNVPEVPSPTGPQLALHYVNIRICLGAGRASEMHGLKLAPAPESA